MSVFDETVTCIFQKEDFSLCVGNNQGSCQDKWDGTGTPKARRPAGHGTRRRLCPAGQGHGGARVLQDTGHLQDKFEGGSGRVDFGAIFGAFDGSAVLLPFARPPDECI